MNRRRIGARAVAARLTIFTFLGVTFALACCEIASAKQCGYTPHVYSLMDRQPSNPTVVRTNDSSVMFWLSSSGQSATGRWTASPALLGSHYPFGSGGRERVDVSAVQSEIEIRSDAAGSNDRCSIWFVRLDVIDDRASATTAHDTQPAVDSYVAVMTGTNWGPVDLPGKALSLSNDITLHDIVLSSNSVGDAPTLHLTGRLSFAKHRSISIADMVLTPRRLPQNVVALAAGHTIDYGLVPDRPNVPNWLSPRLQVTQLKCTLEEAVDPETRCTATASLILAGGIRANGRPSIPLTSENNGTFSGTYRTPGSAPVGSLKITYQSSRDLKSSAQPAASITLEKLTADLGAATVPLRATGTVCMDTSAGAGVLRPIQRSPRHGFCAACSLPLQLQQVGIFRHNDNSLQPNYGPIGSFTAESKDLGVLARDDFMVQQLSGSFDPTSNGRTANLLLDGVLRAWIPPLPAVAPVIRKQARSGEVAPSEAVARAIATPTPAPLIAAKLTGVYAVTSATSVENINSWAFDFRSAHIEGVDNSNGVWGHKLETCDKKQLDALHVSLSATQLCVGVHLSVGPGVEAENDVIYAIANIVDCAAQDEDRANETACLQGDPHRFHVDGMYGVLPSEKPIKVRFGGGWLNITGIRLDLRPTDSINDFETDIGRERLAQLGCEDLRMSGTASVDSALTSGQSVGLTDSAGPGATPAPANASGKASLLATNSRDIVLAATPEIGLGPNCTAFRLSGFLPLQISSQSSLLVTHLTYAHSRVALDPNHPTNRDYMQVSGAFTSGTVTIVFNKLGYRTIAGKQSNCDAGKDYGEKQYGNLCVVTDINWKLSAGVTGAENASSIGRTITAAVGAIGGFLIGKVR